MSVIFESKIKSTDIKDKEEKTFLYKKIGKLKVEINFLKVAFGL